MVLVMKFIEMRKRFPDVARSYVKNLIYILKHNLISNQIPFYTDDRGVNHARFYKRITLPDTIYDEGRTPTGVGFGLLNGTQFFITMKDIKKLINIAEELTIPA